LFVLMQTFPLLGEWQLQTLAREHGIRKDRETDMLDKLFDAFLRRADEGTLSRLLVEAVSSLHRVVATEGTPFARRQRHRRSIPMQLPQR
jgi:hypothetical protein